MDGKNVFDFVDPDILANLQKLEDEEDAIRDRMEEDNDDNDSDESSELSEDLVEAHEEVMENKVTIRSKHKLVTGSQLPRKVRDLTATEKFMTNIRTDKSEAINELKMLSQKKRRETKDRLKKHLLNESTNKNDDEEMEDDEYDNNLEEMMDLDGTEEKVVKKFKKSKLSPEEEAAQKRKERIEHQKQEAVERMQRKIQKGWNRESRVNESDRKIGSKLPKHLNTGKRGIGKNDRR
jgi:nucleolar GTP-binding protein